jgi:CheY-like chemotaxis protein
MVFRIMVEKRVLAVGVERAALESVPPGLVGEAFELDQVPTSRSAIAILTEVRFDLIVVGHPLPGLEVHPFLRNLRKQSCASRAAKVIVLAGDPEHNDLVGLHAHAVEIVAENAALIGDLTSKALGGTPRLQVNLIVRLEVELPYGHSIRICQSENISESGMLVRTDDTVPVGTVGLVSFQLPARDQPTEARVRVVRETVAGEIPGIALHFEEFQEEAQADLRSFIAAQSSR